MKLKIKRFLMWNLFRVWIPYTREELDAAGIKRVDNSDLNNLLKAATKKAQEKIDGKRLVPILSTEEASN